MSRRRHRASAVARGIVYVLLLLLLLAMIGGAYYFTDGFQTGFKSFYVKIGDEIILSESAGVSVDFGSDLRVDCKYLLQGVDKDNANYKKYSVRIVPNVDSEHDFVYFVGGQSYLFSKQSDFSSGFEVEKSDGYFVVKMTKTVPEILSGQYAGEFRINEEIAWDQYPYFAFIVTSYDDKTSIRIPFGYVYRVNGIAIDKNEEVL